MAKRRFSYFVVFAEMRTGSNFLEANLNQFSDLRCDGELFNPVFVGSANQDSHRGITLGMREENPGQLIRAIKDADSNVIPGFRFFNDHDPRVFEKCLADPECAKIVLTRNSLDSYVSRKIAGQTGQWKLTDMKHQRSAKVNFDRREFESIMQTTQAFQLRLMYGLQITGQTAFYINYDDINSLEVLNGLAKYVGSTETAKSLKKNLKKQNPGPVTSKVVNPAEMRTALGEIDFMNLSRTPSFEPRRGPGVPGLVACRNAPILYLPIKGTATATVLNWMYAHDGGEATDVEARMADEDVLHSGFNQKTLRQWVRGNPDFHAFTVVQHPLERAYAVFDAYIYRDDNPEYADIRLALRNKYKIALPKAGSVKNARPDAEQMRPLFLGFIKFLKGNLAAQTGVRVDPAWASQSNIIQAMTTVLPMGQIIRQHKLAEILRSAEAMLSLTHLAIDSTVENNPVVPLSDIYDKELESAANDVYGRDYLNFGFGDWSPG